MTTAAGARDTPWDLFVAAARELVVGAGRLQAILLGLPGQGDQCLRFPRDRDLGVAVLPVQVGESE
jgi:hypothetical protein